MFTQANEVLAVERLQGQLGRKLAIVHTYLKWQAPFPTSSALTFLDQGSMLLISWAGTDTRQIVSGADDAWIRTPPPDQGARQAGVPGVAVEWTGRTSVPGAFRGRVRGRLGSYPGGIRRGRGAQCRLGVVPTANGFSDGQAAAFYPGDNEVDWICADAYPAYGSTASFGSTVTAFLGWAAHYDKPVMIGEFGVPESDGTGQRARWLRAAQQVVLADRQIKALLYFDANPAGQEPQGSYSLAGDAAALSAFRAIAAQPYFNPAVTG